MKVVIAGSREGFDFLEVQDGIKASGFEVTEVVSGTARGVDKLGEKWARMHIKDVKRFPADWKKLGKSAGYKRNVQMAEYSDALIAFWYNKSKGTGHMINIAKEKGLQVFVIEKND